MDKIKDLLVSRGVNVEHVNAYDAVKIPKAEFDKLWADAHFKPSISDYPLPDKTKVHVVLDGKDMNGVLVAAVLEYDLTNESCRRWIELTDPVEDVMLVVDAE